MKVKVAKYSPIPMNLFNVLTTNTVSCGIIYEVIVRLTHYFSFVGLNVKTADGTIFIRITKESDINKLVDENGNVMSLDHLVYDFAKKSITIVDLYGADIFKVKFK